MMNSCRVFIEPLDESTAESIAALPEGLALKASLVGGKQVVISKEVSLLECLVFAARTSLPVNVAGFPAFLLLRDKTGQLASRVQGTASTTSIGKVEFSAAKVDVEKGFYKYEIVIGGQVAVEGSCVVR